MTTANDGHSNGGPTDTAWAAKAVPTTRAKKPRSPLIALYRLLLRQQLTGGRVVLAVVLGVLAIVVTTLITDHNDGNRLVFTVEFLSVFGLGLSIPILSLVMGSSSLGQLVEDETLVYLWLRPVPRWMLAGAAWLAVATVAVPMVTAPLAVAAIMGSGGDLRTSLAVALASALATMAYTGLFTFIGLVLRRSLIWGLVYVFIWELFVARVGQGAARLSINTYPMSVLARITDVELPLAERSMASAVAVPLLVVVVAVLLTAWRLNRTSVA